MAASTVPHGTVVWKMFAGVALAGPTATTAVTKALKIASAYFQRLIVPAVTNSDSARFLSGRTGQPRRAAPSRDCSLFS